MKLLADKFINERPIDPVEREISDLLRLPAVNHAPSSEMVALCDRFVFDEAAMRALSHDVTPWSEKFPPTGRRLHVPCNPMWIDAHGGSGWLVKDRIAYCIFDCRHFGLRYVGAIDLDSFDGVEWEWKASRFSAAVTPQSAPRENLEIAVALIFGLLFALGVPHAVSTRRIVPGLGLERGQAAFAARRAQRGLPVYSYNRVEMQLPRASMHNGVLRTAESFAGTRMHQVIGHWRLIDGVVEPYWIWIDGHTRGNADLGTIVKERNVHLAPNAVRRGFPIPNDAGRAGERRAAALLPSLAQEVGR